MIKRRAAGRRTQSMAHGNGCMMFRRREVAPKDGEVAEKNKDTSAGVEGPTTPTQHEEVAVFPTSVQLSNVGG